MKVARKINFNHFLENTYYQQTKYYLNSEGDLAFNMPKFERTNDEINKEFVNECMKIHIKENVSVVMCSTKLKYDR